MHPLSLFPIFLSYGLVVPTLLRLTVGVVGLLAGYARYKKEYSWTSIFYFVVSVLIILGFYMQGALVAGLAILWFDYFVDRKTIPITGERKILYTLVKIILIALLFTGPGFFALDLPL